MTSTNENERRKELKCEFLRYLEKRIPTYRMPAKKFFNEINTAFKKFAGEQGYNISSILDIDDVPLLKVWLGKISNNGRSVFQANNKETKVHEGLRYYIDFLESRNRRTAPAAVVPADESTSAPIEECTPVPAEENAHAQNEDAEDSLDKATEGMMQETRYFRRKRNRAIRNECAKKYHYRCYVCGMDFEKVYGERGHEFIEVHHTKPLSSYEGEHEIPLEDLRALCSNCHSMVHHGKDLLDVDMLKELYDKNKNGRDLY